jgi:hypothetical protein
MEASAAPKASHDRGTPAGGLVVPGGRFAPVGNPNWRSFFFTPLALIKMC